MPIDGCMSCNVILCCVYDHVMLYVWMHFIFILYDAMTSLFVIYEMDASRQMIMIGICIFHMHNL
jgi:hypothetical protein